MVVGMVFSRFLTHWWIKKDTIPFRFPIILSRQVQHCAVIIWTAMNVSNQFYDLSVDTLVQIRPADEVLKGTTFKNHASHWKSVTGTSTKLAPALMLAIASRNRRLLA